MNAAAISPAWKRRIAFWLVGVAVAASLLWFLVTCARIVLQASNDESRPTSAIVVFGAAEYVGHPSPVYRARLNHAFDLFQSGMAPVVITTGGSGLDPSYSEGGVGREYLLSRGIPDPDLIAETQSDNTAESAKRVGVIMRANGMKTCLAVSDAFHVFRVKQMLKKEGFIVYASPRPDSEPRSTVQRTLSVSREAISYIFWRLHIT